MKKKKQTLNVKKSIRITKQEDEYIMQYAEDNGITYSKAFRKLALESLYK